MYSGFSIIIAIIVIIAIIIINRWSYIIRGRNYLIVYSIQNSFQLFLIVSHEFSDFYFYFIPAAAPLIAIPDRIQKAKSVGTDKSKKNNIVKSILGNVQSNVQTPRII